MTSKYTASGAYGVELKCPAVTQESINLYFGWIPELYKKRIKYIDFYYAEDALAPSGNPLYTGDDSYLTLANHQNVQFLNTANIIEFFSLPYTRARRMLFNREVDTTSSFVTIQNPNFTEEKSLFFVFWYEEPAVRNQFLKYDPNGSRNLEDVELIANIGQKRVFFPDNRVIVDQPITNVFPWNDGNATPNGFPFIPLDAFRSAYLTLSKGNFLFVKNVPLPLLTMDGKAYILELENVAFDTTGSFVEFAQGIDITEKSALFFNVEMQAL